MKFNHLNVPDHWQQYWSRYPEGYTILEALISWVSQVDDMVDNQNKLNETFEQFRKELDDFVGRFDERLQDEVSQTLREWQESGFIDVVISEALQWQLDNYITTNEQDKTYINQQLQIIDEAKFNKSDMVGGRVKGVSYGLNNEDGIWSWWTSNAVRINKVRDKAYLGLVSRTGQQGLMSFNYDSGIYERVTFSQHERDDHNAPAIIALDNDTVLSFYTRHSSDNKIRWRVTRVRESIVEYGEENFYEAEGLTTYVQLFKYGNQVKVLFRVQTPTTNKFMLATYSTVSNTIISVVPIFESTTQSYVRLTPSRAYPTLLVGFVYQHPIYGTDNHIRYVEIELSNGDVRTSSSTGMVKIANIDEPNVPVTLSQLGIAYESTNNKKTRLLDVPSSNSVRFAFITFDDENNGEYHVGIRRENTWFTSKITDSGKPFEEPAGANYYFGGVALLHNNPNIAYVSKENGGTWSIEKIVSSDNGNTWAVDSVIDSSDTKKLLRPVCLIGGDEDHAGFYQKGYFTTYSDYLTDIYSLNS